MGLKNGYKGVIEIGKEVGAVYTSSKKYKKDIKSGVDKSWGIEANKLVQTFSSVANDIEEI